jgi:methylated-DNA-protein-cysteine methyltransferase related protein
MSWAPVYRLVQQIPRGRVLTYGALARALRLPGGARAAGRAMAGTPRGQGIPWHRVVGDGGRILLREPFASLQQRLLEADGIEVSGRRINLSNHLWMPPGSSRKQSGRKPTIRTRKVRRRRALRRSPKKQDTVL